VDKLDLWKKTTSLRKQLGADASCPIDIFSLALTDVKCSTNLTLVLYPMGDRLSGMCIKGNDNTVIAINSAMSDGRQRFSMAHELFHVYFDSSLSTAICSIRIGAGNEIEREADQFASFLLMPPDALEAEVVRIKKETDGRLAVSHIVELEQHFRVSRQAMLFRLVQDNELTAQEAEPMKHDVIKSARNLGYDDSLYKPLPPDRQHMTYGYYIQRADEILGKGLVSNGKYEELLLEAFRSDLVYGEESEKSESVD
jgi:Zn-dependent peptidase ImmA (M78 family)